jgi:predicted GNAT family N-acyltransferase
VDLVDLGRLTEEQYAELVGDEVDPWGAAGVTLDWRAKDRHVVVRDDCARLVAAAGLVEAEVQFGERPPVPVVGIGGVIVSAPHRRRGYGQRVIAAAIRRAQEMGPDVAMLFCRPALVERYRGHGFAEVPGPVLVDQPSGAVEMPWVTMWRPLKHGATFGDGIVKLHGLPF